MQSFLLERPVKSFWPSLIVSIQGVPESRFWRDRGQSRTYLFDEQLTDVSVRK